jgi:hypothetical protein
MPMLYLVFALMFLGGIAAGTYLVVSGHPWFALLVFVITGSLSLRHSDGKNEVKEKIPGELPDLSKVVRAKSSATTNIND